MISSQLLLPALAQQSAESGSRALRRRHDDGQTRLEISTDDKGEKSSNSKESARGDCRTDRGSGKKHRKHRNRKTYKTYKTRKSYKCYKTRECDGRADYLGEPSRNKP